MRTIPFSIPFFGIEESKAVFDVVKSTWLVQGKKVEEFEREFARYIGTKEAVAVFNGTVALHLAMIVADVKVYDEVIVPSFTFIATANAILYQNATPVFTDIDTDSFNISSEDVEKKITKMTKAIVPVHYGGQVADMDSIMEIAKENNLIVIEDAAEAHGARYKGRHSGTFGDLAIFSFTPIKNMTTGEGGIITTNNTEFAEKLRMLRNHGMDAPYHHVMLGYNYRMTEMQAALGLIQLKRLDKIVERKNNMANFYNKSLGNISTIQIPYISPFTTQHGYMLYTIKVPISIRDILVKELNIKGIETRSTYFPPVHLQPYYRNRFGFKEGLLPKTEKVAKEIISLPISPMMSREDIDYVIENITEISLKLEGINSEDKFNTAKGGT